MSGPKRFVYHLKSDRESHPYIGITSDVARRLETHNSGGNSATAPFRPWRVDVMIEFSDEVRAIRLERYLKSGSGHAFAKRHLL